MERPDRPAGLFSAILVRVRLALLTSCGAQRKDGEECRVPTMLGIGLLAGRSPFLPSRCDSICIGRRGRGEAKYRMRHEAEDRGLPAAKALW